MIRTIFWWTVGSAFAIWVAAVLYWGVVLQRWWFNKEGKRMKITLTDKEVRDAIAFYVKDIHADEAAEVTVLSITRHHGGTVSAQVKVDTK